MNPLNVLIGVFGEKEYNSFVAEENVLEPKTKCFTLRHLDLYVSPKEQSKNNQDATEILSEKIRTIAPDILVIGQTVEAEQVLQQRSDMTSCPLIIRYSKFYCENYEPYTTRNAAQLGYHLDSPKNPKAIVSLLQSEAFLAAFRSRDSIALIRSLPPDIKHIPQAPLWPECSQTRVVVQNPRVNKINNAHNETEKKTYFDLVLTDKRVVIKLYGWWLDHLGLYSQRLSQLMNTLDGKGYSDYLIDLTDVECFSHSLVGFTGPLLNASHDTNAICQTKKTESGLTVKCIPFDSTSPSYNRRFHFLFKKGLWMPPGPSYFAEIAAAEMGNPSGEEVLSEIGTLHNKTVDYNGITSHRVLGNVNFSELVEDQNRYHNALCFGLILERGSIKILPFQAHGKFPWASNGDETNEILMSRPYVLAERTRTVLADALEEFQWLLNRDSSEQTFQDLFKRHPELLFGNSYCKVHSHLVLERGDGPLIPDFFMEPLVGGMVDVLDLKHPGKRVVVGSKNRRRFSSDVYEGIAQLQSYANWFEDPENRKLFHRKYGLGAYKPKCILVIGRSFSVDDQLTTRRLHMQETNSQIFTYDDLLELGQRRLLL
jgi:hypothetical protein